MADTWKSPFCRREFGASPYPLISKKVLRVAELVALGVIGRNFSYILIVNVFLKLVYLQKQSAIGRIILLLVHFLTNGFELAAIVKMLYIIHIC